MPEVIQTAQSSPQHFLGPNVLSVLAQSVETGVLINQVSRFMTSSWERENLWVRSVVVFACVVAFIQTGLAFQELYDVYVRHFGNWAYAILPSGYDDIQPVLTVLQAAPVQLFLIWRCYRILGRRRYIILPLIILLIGSFASNVLTYTTVLQYQFSFLQYIPLVEYTTSLQLAPSFVAAESITAALDLCLTVILTVFLFRSKGEVSSQRFRTTIDRLIIFLWESAIPPAACACATVITYADDLRLNNTWDLFFQAALGKLYVISFFVTLNARDAMRRRSLSPDTLDISNMSFRTPVQHPEENHDGWRLERANESEASPDTNRKKRLW